MNTEFINPVKNLPESETSRTATDYVSADAAFLKGIHGRAGTVQTTANILLSKLVNELKRNGFQALGYDPATFERAVADCRIILGCGANGSELPGSPTPLAPAGKQSPRARKATR